MVVYRSRFREQSFLLHVFLSRHHLSTDSAQGCHGVCSKLRHRTLQFCQVWQHWFCSHVNGLPHRRRAPLPAQRAVAPAAAEIAAEVASVALPPQGDDSATQDGADDALQGGEEPCSEERSNTNKFKMAHLEQQLSFSSILFFLRPQHSQNLRIWKKRRKKPRAKPIPVKGTK